MKHNIQKVARFWSSLVPLANDDRMADEMALADWLTHSSMAASVSSSVFKEQVSVS